MQVEDESFWFRHRNDCIAALVRRNRPSGPVLDVGGGNGFVTRRLMDEGLDATLLEPGIAGATNAKWRRCLPEVVCATLEDVAFPDTCIPAIGAFDVLEHIEDDRAFIGEVYRVLILGGLYFATVPAHSWLWSAADVHAGHFR